MRTEDQARQRIGAVVFCAGAVATLAWAVGALLTLLDLALGATAPTYMPWLAAGAIPVTIAVAGVWLHGGMPWVTRRAGWLGAAWGAGLLFFIGAIDAIVHGANHVRLGGPSGQAEANALVRAVVVELVLTAAIPAGIALWRRRWFPTLVAGAVMVCIIGLLDTIFIVMASVPF